MKPATAKFGNAKGGFTTGCTLVLVLITDHKGAA
jgi:hypothetical protein